MSQMAGMCSNRIMIIATVITGSVFCFAASHEIRVYAQKHNLKPSWTDYHKWGKGHRMRLRFSKSGNARIEELYATHYVGQAKIEDARKKREAQSREAQKREAAQADENFFASTSFDKTSKGS